MAQVIEFESLGSADLIVDAVYEGKDRQLASDPIAKLLPGSRSGDVYWVLSQLPLCSPMNDPEPQAQDGMEIQMTLLALGMTSAQLEELLSMTS